MLAAVLKYERKVGEMVFLYTTRLLAQEKGTNDTGDAVNSCRPGNTEITKAAGENLLKKTK